jgi:hypothetical protein
LHPFIGSTAFSTTSRQEEERRECRVCLEGSEGLGNELMNICGCTGSLKYIHRLCLQDWLLRKYEESETKTDFKEFSGLACEICHKQYSVEFALQMALGDCANFTGKVRANRCAAAVNVLFVAADIVCLAFSCNYAVQDYQQEDFSIGQAKYFLVYVAIILSLMSTIYGVY